jgi:hypothetical protein
MTFFMTLHWTYNIGFIFGYMAGLKEAVTAKNKPINALGKVET